MRAALHRRVLGIEGATSAEDIRRRHRTLMLRYHPDRAPRGRETEFLERAKELNLAREWLLLHPECWRVETAVPTTSPTPEAAVARRVPSSSIESKSVGWAQGIASWATVAIVIYLGLLAFAILGWVASTALSLVLG